jgi:hypothetical protein
LPHIGVDVGRKLLAMYLQEQLRLMQAIGLLRRDGVGLVLA